MARVFISYARPDERWAKELRVWLERRGYETWMDVDRLRGGDRWTDEISREIYSADAVVSLWTAAAIVSQGYFHDEWAFAGQLQRARVDRRFLIPISADGTFPTPDAHGMHVIDMTRGDGFDVLADSLPPVGDVGERRDRLAWWRGLGGLRRRSRLAVGREAYLGRVDGRAFHLPRPEDVEVLGGLCRDASLIFVVGRSGCGKSTVVRDELRAAARRGGWLPIYMNNWGDGIEQHLRIRLCEAVAEARSEPVATLRWSDVTALFDGGTSSARMPLLILDQYDEYAALTGEGPLDMVSGGFWELIARAVRARRLTCVVVSRLSKARSMERVRFVEPRYLALGGLHGHRVGPFLDEFMLRGPVPLVSEPEATWPQVRDAVVEVLSREGEIMPAELVLTMQGLAALDRLDGRALKRQGGIEGLGRRLFEQRLAGAEARCALSRRRLVMLLGEMVQSGGVGRTASLERLQALLGAEAGGDQLLHALDVLWSERLVRPALSAGQPARWALQHDLLAPLVLDAMEASVVLRRRVDDALRAWDRAEGLRARWQALLPPQMIWRLLRSGRGESGASPEAVDDRGRRRIVALSLLRFVPFVLFFGLAVAGIITGYQGVVHRRSIEVLALYEGMRGGLGEGAAATSEFADLLDRVAALDDRQAAVFLERLMDPVTAPRRATHAPSEMLVRALAGEAADRRAGLRERVGPRLASMHPWRWSATAAAAASVLLDAWSPEDVAYLTLGMEAPALARRVSGLLDGFDGDGLVRWFAQLGRICRTRKAPRSPELSPLGRRIRPAEPLDWSHLARRLSPEARARLGRLYMEADDERCRGTLAWVLRSMGVELPRALALRLLDGYPRGPLSARGALPPLPPDLRLRIDERAARQSGRWDPTLDSLAVRLERAPEMELELWSEWLMAVGSADDDDDLSLPALGLPYHASPPMRSHLGSSTLPSGLERYLDGLSAERAAALAALLVDALPTAPSRQFVSIVLRIFVGVPDAIWTIDPAGWLPYASRASDDLWVGALPPSWLDAHRAQIELWMTSDAPAAWRHVLWDRVATSDTARLTRIHRANVAPQLEALLDPDRQRPPTLSAGRAVEWFERYAPHLLRSDRRAIAARLSPAVVSRVRGGRGFAWRIVGAVCGDMMPGQRRRMLRPIERILRGRGQPGLDRSAIRRALERSSGLGGCVPETAWTAAGERWIGAVAEGRCNHDSDAMRLWTSVPTGVRRALAPMVAERGRAALRTAETPASALKAAECLLAFARLEDVPDVRPVVDRGLGAHLPADVELDSAGWSRFARYVRDRSPTEDEAWLVSLVGRLCGPTSGMPTGWMQWPRRSSDLTDWLPERLSELEPELRGRVFSDAVRGLQGGRGRQPPALCVHVLAPLMHDAPWSAQLALVEHIASADEPLGDHQIPHLVDLLGRLEGSTGRDARRQLGWARVVERAIRLDPDIDWRRLPPARHGAVDGWRLLAASPFVIEPVRTSFRRRVERASVSRTGGLRR